MSEMITIEVRVSTDLVGCECTNTFEIQRDVWESMDERDRDAECKEVMFEMIEWGYEVKE